MLAAYDVADRSTRGDRAFRRRRSAFGPDGRRTAGCDAGGRYLVLSHATADPVHPAVRDVWDEEAASGRHGDFKYRRKARDQDAPRRLVPVPPSLVPVAEWRRPADPLRLKDRQSSDLVRVAVSCRHGHSSQALSGGQ
jgi:hypothetical protein